LRRGHKAAYLCMKTTVYTCIEHLHAPKRWFESNVDAIIRQCGLLHQIQKENLCLGQSSFFSIFERKKSRHDIPFTVFGTLDTPDYALLVSHHHPDGQAHFNVHSSPRNGRPWGTWTDGEPEQEGPSYDEPISGRPLLSRKVSITGGGPWGIVLVACLRLKPNDHKSDALEATSF